MKGTGQESLCIFVTILLLICERLKVLKTLSSNSGAPVRAKGARKRSTTPKKFWGEAEKIWLSRDFPSVRPYIRTYAQIRPGVKFPPMCLDVRLPDLLTQKHFRFR